MQNLTDSEIDRIRMARRALEIDVAKTIGKHLMANQGGYIKSLILCMIDKILSAGEYVDLGIRTHYLLKTQKTFAMWSLCGTTPSWNGLQEVRHHVVNDGLLPGYAWLNVCSDVIRLFGELAEDEVVKKASEDANWYIMAQKDKLRPEPVFAKPEKSQEGWGHRHRENRVVPVAMLEEPFIHIDRHTVNWRGVEKFRFGKDSVIENIDWTYGLQKEGADVSGTTADSIAALRWAWRSTGLVNPIVHLIAIATMVPQGHHTIVECAWPLTRHKYMDYAIGFYDTLVLPGQDCGGLSDSLRTWNNDVRNKHVFLCRDASRTLQLNFWFDKPDEIEEYRKIADLRRAYSFCVGGRPYITTVETLMKTSGVRDLVISRMYNWVGRN